MFNRAAYMRKERSYNVDIRRQIMPSDIQHPVLPAMEGGDTQVPQMSVVLQQEADKTVYEDRISAMQDGASIGCPIPYSRVANITSKFPIASANEGDPMFTLKGGFGFYTTLDGFAYDEQILSLANSDGHGTRVREFGDGTMRLKPIGEIRRRLKQDLLLRMDVLGFAIKEEHLQQGMYMESPDGIDLMNTNTRFVAVKGLNKFRNNSNYLFIAGQDLFLWLPPMTAGPYGGIDLKKGMYKPIARAIDGQGDFLRETAQTYAAMFTDDGLYNKSKHVMADIAQPRIILRLISKLALALLYDIEALRKAGEERTIPTEQQFKRQGKRQEKSTLDFREERLSERSSYSFDQRDKDFSLTHMLTPSHKRRRDADYKPTGEEMRDILDGYYKGRDDPNLVRNTRGNKELNLYSLVGTGVNDSNNSKKDSYGLVQKKMTAVYIQDVLVPRTLMSFFRGIQTNMAGKYLGRTTVRVSGGGISVLARNLK